MRSATSGFSALCSFIPRMFPFVKSPAAQAEALALQLLDDAEAAEGGEVAEVVEVGKRHGVGQGESDCLIKTKHCDGLRRCWRNVISAQCSECQSDEIQTSAGKRRE